MWFPGGRVMSWMRRAWDGPFKAAPQETITVGWALLKLFETIWRLILIVAALVASLAIYLWLAERNPLSSQVGVELSSSPSDCTAKGFPILAHIENNSNKTIGEVDLQLRVFPQGTSKDVADLGSYQQQRNILRPGETLDWCYAMPQLEAGSTGPYTVAASVNYVSELSKDVPITSRPDPYAKLVPPPLVRLTPLPLHPPSPPQTIWTKIRGGIVVIFSLVLFASGGFGLIALCHRMFGVQVLERFRSKKGDNRGWLIFLFAILNLSIVQAGSFALTALRMDGWVTILDTWSWAHGLQDGGLMLLAALVAQWTWALWFAINGPTRSVE
jgi:hypothetical protein